MSGFLSEASLAAWERTAKERLQTGGGGIDALRTSVLVAEVRSERAEIEKLRAALRAVLVCGCGIGPCECAEDYRPAARAALGIAATKEGP